jgi:glycosyltransferase involved in cell wall biosynthesis
MARIAIVTAGHFSTSPRVWREADALAARHDVTVIGVCFDPPQADIEKQMLRSRAWRYLAAADLRPLSISSRLRWNYHRFRARWGRFCLSKGWPDPYSLGYAVHSLLAATRGEKADLTILHLESGLWVGTHLKREGFRLGVDIEDWYSESQPRNPARHDMLRRLETEVLPAAVHATTTSHALATALAGAYGIPKPVVIYNGDPVVPPGEPPPLEGPLRMIWFSQTVGLDRGLGDILAVLPRLLGDWELEIRGRASPDIFGWLKKCLSATVRSHVHMEPPVPPDRLMDVIARHDLGLALDPPLCLNRDLTVPNKQVQYLQAGLSVLSADTSGAREVQSAFPEVVYLYPPGQPSLLAERINELIHNRRTLIERRGAIQRAANERFGYERQAPRLLESVERALQTKITTERVPG